MSTREIGKVFVWIVVVIALMGGYMLSAKEKQTEQATFVQAMAKSHSTKAISICSQLVSPALNVDSYKTDFEKCVSVVESTQ